LDIKAEGDNRRLKGEWSELGKRQDALWTSREAVIELGSEIIKTGKKKKSGG